MKNRGEVVRITSEGDIIGRFSTPLEVGTKIMDKRKKNIGKVTWIFGPVDDPFLEIKTHFEPHRRISISNEPIYAEEI